MTNNEKSVLNYDDEIIKETVRHNIITYRNTLKLTQEQVAAALGVSRATYANYEKRTPPPHYIIAKLSKMYRIPIETFFLDNELETAKQPYTFSSNVNGIYGERHFTELSDFEKSLIMQVRQLNKEDRDKLVDYLMDIAPQNSTIPTDK